MKVLCIGANVYGVNLYRVFHQAEALKQRGWEVYVNDYRRDACLRYGLDLGEPVSNWLEWAIENGPDIIYTDYSNDLRHLAKLELLREKCDIPYVMDVDDAFEHLPGYNQASTLATQHSKYMMSWRAHFKAAGTLTTTTEALAETLCKPAQVVPNFTRREYWVGPKRNHTDTRIIFTGASAGRWAEVEFMKPIIRWLSRIHPDVKIILTAALPNWAIELSNVYVLSWCEAPDYFNLLNHVNPDIGLAPLVDNPFNRGKSGLKYYEYGLCGAAGIYSDLPPYREVRNDITGLVISNDVEAWKEALGRLIVDKEYRIGLAKGARAAVLQNHVSTDRLDQVLREVLRAGSRHQLQPEAQNSR